MRMINDSRWNTGIDERLSPYMQLRVREKDQAPQESDSKPEFDRSRGTAYVSSSSSCASPSPTPTHKPPHTCPLTPTDPQAGTKEKEEAHIPAITIQFGGFYVLNGGPEPR